MQVVKLLAWGLSISEARHYGYRYALHIGNRLIFFWPLPE
jgi:hypothetical protein